MITPGAMLMAEEGTFTVEGPLRSIPLPFLNDIFGEENACIAESVVSQWVVMIILAVLFFVLGRNLKLKPEGKRQVIAEWIVGFFSVSEKSISSEKRGRL